MVFVVFVDSRLTQWMSHFLLNDLGLERVVMLYLNLGNIRKVGPAFPIRIFTIGPHANILTIY